MLRWAKLLGPAPMTLYIARFLQHEIEKKEHTELKIWKDHLTDMLSQAIEKRFPMEKMSVLTFSNAHRQCNNASVSLVIALNCCAKTVNELITVEFKNRNSFGTFFKTVCPQRIGASNHIIYQFLSWFDFSGQVLDLADFFKADFQHSQFIRTELNYINAMQANLYFCDLSGARVSSANLSHADLSHADLRHTDLNHADLRNADLRNANLRIANLRDADLRDADLRDADLTGAHLTGAKLLKSQIGKIKLSKAQLAVILQS